MFGGKSGLSTQTSVAADTQFYNATSGNLKYDAIPWTWTKRPDRWVVEVALPIHSDGDHGGLLDADASNDLSSFDPSLGARYWWYVEAPTLYFYLQEDSLFFVVGLILLAPNILCK
jgi:hypothetical protein